MTLDVACPAAAEVRHKVRPPHRGTSAGRARLASHSAVSQLGLRQGAYIWRMRQTHDPTRCQSAAGLQILIRRVLALKIPIKVSLSWGRKYTCHALVYAADFLLYLSRSNPSGQRQRPKLLWHWALASTAGYFRLPCAGAGEETAWGIFGLQRSKVLLRRT